MNERIEKLAKKAGFGVYGEIYSPNDEDSPITKNIEKFAELIVRECMEVANIASADLIKEHFGVEE
jgi:exoribonuclease II